jgi:hypothetical protein
MNARKKLKALKIKLANLQLEIEDLMSKGMDEPGVIDAIIADITDMTEEMVSAKKQLIDFKKNKKDKKSTTEGLFELYDKIKNK